MKKLVLFDVDGTLAESSEKIDDEMKELLKNLSEKHFTLGIVGGGRLDKILDQLDNNIYITHYFTECGCVYHKRLSNNNNNNNNKLDLVYSKNLRSHALYDSINILIKHALYFLSQVDYTLTGNFIDLRNGIVYISLIGLNATKSEREVFFKLDEKNHYRKRLLSYLDIEAINEQIENEITITEGGRAGIAIYPNEYDKIQVLEYLEKDYKEIHYFGDKYEKGGNDYRVISSDKVIGHPVDSVAYSKKIIRQLIEESKLDKIQVPFRYEDFPF